MANKTQPNQTDAKETRLSVRISPAQKAIIARAARLSNATLTAFVIDNAVQAAAQLLDEETHIRMTPDEFKHFCRALDSPPAKNLKAMRKLLNEPSILDE